MSKLQYISQIFLYHKEKVGIVGPSNGDNASATSIPLPFEISPGSTPIGNAQLPATKSSAIDANDKCEGNHNVASIRSSQVRSFNTISTRPGILQGLRCDLLISELCRVYVDNGSFRFVRGPWSRKG